MKRLPTKAADGIYDSPDVLPNMPAGWQDLPLSSTTSFGGPIVPAAATGGDGVVDQQSSHIFVAAAASGDDGSGSLDGMFAATSVPASAASTSLANPATDSLGAFTGSPDGGSVDGGAAWKSMEIVDHYGLTDLDAAVAINGSGTIPASLLAFAAPIPANAAAYALDAPNGSTSMGFNSAAAPPAPEGIVGRPTDLHSASPSESGSETTGIGSAHAATSAAAPVEFAGLANQVGESIEQTVTNAGVGANGAVGAQVEQALNEGGLTINGSGITVGVLSDSFNNLGGAAADETDGALPPAADVDVIKDLASGGSDEGRAMMQIIHDIAPGADLAFYTAFDGEQDFANGILALAAAGCKVIVDDVSYFDEPFFQNGVVAQAIQTVEAEGVTYITAAGNEASNGYQAAWTPISTSFHGTALTDAESFGGSPVQTVTINTEGTGDAVPLVLEWNQAYGSVGASTADLEILVFNSSGTLIGTASNASNGESTNPWVEYDFAASGTYSVAIENLHPGTNPGLIKEITEGDGLPATISGSNIGTVVGHAMTPGAITAGAVYTGDTPFFGVNPAVSESFSSSGAGTELLFTNNGTPLSSPDVLSPVVVSGVDGINTTVPGGLSDFFGTSAASASLAGVAALILAANPNLTPAQVETIMEETALPMANSAVSGAGLAQVDPAVAAAHGNQPDLTAYLSNGSMTAAAGSSIDLETWTDNFGGVSEASSTTAIFLSTAPTITTSDTLLGTVSVPALASEDFVGWYNYQLVSMTLPSNLTPGTYYLGGFADYNGQIVETNNNDNVVQLTVTGPPQPDLTAYLSNGSMTAAAGSSINVQTWTDNLGTASSGPSTTAIFLSSTPTITTSDTLLGTISAPALAAENNAGWYNYQLVSMTLPSNLTPGTYYLGGFADYNGQIVETNNNDNVVQLTVTAPPQPDLTAYLSNGSMTAAAGSSVNVQTWTDNLGAGSSGPSTTAIFLSSTPTITTSDTLLGTISAPALAAESNAGWYNYQLVSMTLPSNLTPGTYYLGGFADYNGQIVETNNNDNVVQLTVTGPPQPDLTAYLSNGSMTAAAGSSINVQTWTDNLGTASSGPSTTAIFLSSTPTITTSDTLLGTISAPALAAENNAGWYNYQLVSMTLPSNLTPGTYYLGGFADYNGQIVETNNNDNVVQLTVTAATAQLASSSSMGAHLTEWEHYGGTLNMEPGGAVTDQMVMQTLAYSAAAMTPLGSVRIGGPGNDAFIFKSDLGVDATAAVSADPVKHESSSHLLTHFNEFWTAQLFFAAADNAHHAGATNLGIHGGVAYADELVPNFHAASLVVHGPIAG